MKDQFSKKGIELKDSDTDPGIKINRIEEDIDPYRELSLDQLQEMIDKSGKFFRISAKLSINSN